jgi:hypothetical protein
MKSRRLVLFCEKREKLKVRNLWIFVHKTEAEARAISVCVLLPRVVDSAHFGQGGGFPTAPQEPARTCPIAPLRPARESAPTPFPQVASNSPLCQALAERLLPRLGVAWVHLHQKPRAWCGIDTSLHNNICSHHPPQPHLPHPLLASHSVCTCVSNTSWPRTLTHNMDGVTVNSQDHATVEGQACHSL